MPICTVCKHPRHHDIDQALLAGSATLSALSQNYGPSLSALWRHKKHLQEKMHQAEKRLEHNLRQGYLFKFNNFLEVATDTVKTAGADGNSRLVLQAVREGTRILNFMTKLDAKMDQDTVYRLLASPQWTTQSSLLPTDPQFIAATHQTLADSLFCPCPEPPPDLDDEDDEDEEDIDEDEDNAWDEDIDEDDDWVGDDLPPTSFLETQNPELETPETPPLETRNLELETLDLLQKLFPSLTEAQPKSEHRELGTENHPLNQREISAKLARKTSPKNNIKQSNQKDKQHKKNTRKEPNVGRESTRRAAYAQAHPADQPLETRNSEPETRNSELETPPPESLFDRLRRKWATTPNAPKYSCDSENFYEEYLKEKEAAGLSDTPPADPEPQSATPPPETANPQPETPRPEPPKTREPLNPVTHPKEYFFAIEHGYRIEDTPKHIPDRRWEEDFGNPRRFKGSY